jgi:AraC-like DNA-binding protein
MRSAERRGTLLEDARRELARHYLLHSSLELNESLGYEDANSFHRAFHHWEETSRANGASSRRTRSRPHKGKRAQREATAKAK